MVHVRRIVLVMIALAGVAGCTTDPNAVGASFVRPAAVSLGSVDGAAAARIISDYRASHGLPPVTVDRRLTQIAGDHALRMAAANELAHVLPGQGSFRQRIEGGGYQASLAAENVGAGYGSLGDAIARWQASPSHDTNLLRPGLTEIGIAVANAPGTRYGTWWSLVLAAPYEGPATRTFRPFSIFGR